MILQQVERAPGAFQEGLSESEVLACLRRAFGPSTVVVSAVELGLGSYNSTYLVSLESSEVILRVAPAPERQFRSERELMRCEYATLPWLGPVAHLIPRVLAADWTQQIIGRDWMVQSVLPGVCAAGGLERWPRPEWAGFYRQLGAIGRRINDVVGPAFGPVNGPHFTTWSGALAWAFDVLASDAESCGLSADDVRAVGALVRADASLLDEVTEPRLLHGDLWTVNAMVDPDAVGPRVTGIMDADRTWWGDPAADWHVRMAGLRPGTERDAFWSSWGPQPARDRPQLYYEARHQAAVRLERHRLGNPDGVARSYADLGAILAELAGG